MRGELAFCYTAHPSQTLKAHTKFVHAATYAGSGTHFISIGADAKVFLWDGVSGERAAEFVDGGDAHKGSVVSKMIILNLLVFIVYVWG